MRLTVFDGVLPFMQERREAPFGGKDQGIAIEGHGGAVMALSTSALRTYRVLISTLATSCSRSVNSIHSDPQASPRTTQGFASSTNLSPR